MIYSVRSHILLTVKTCESVGRSHAFATGVVRIRVSPPVRPCDFVSAISASPENLQVLWGYRIAAITPEYYVVL